MEENEKPKARAKYITNKSYIDQDRKKIFVEAYRMTGGHMENAAKLAKIAKATAYSLLENDKYVMENIEKIKQEFLQKAIDGLRQHLDGTTQIEETVREVLDKNNEIIQLKEEKKISKPPTMDAIFKILAKYGKQYGFTDEQTQGDVSNEPVKIVIK
jgi:uncharacterized protein involved in exopolysaccharide biosynthesis